MHLNGTWPSPIPECVIQTRKAITGAKTPATSDQAILKKPLSVGSLGNFTKLMDTVSKNIATNMSFADMQSIFLNYRDAAKTISTDHLQGVNAWVGDGAHQIASGCGNAAESQINSAQLSAYKPKRLAMKKPNKREELAI